MELYVDSVYTATSLSAPFTFAWNTQGLSGSHTLVAKADDGSGDTGTSAGDTVTVLAPATTPSTVTPHTTPPTVAIVSVVMGSKSFATVSPSDTGDAVTRVELYADGALAATDTVSPWRFKLNTRSWRLGQHALQTKAYDAAGNVGVSGLVIVTK